MILGKLAARKYGVVGVVAWGAGGLGSGVSSAAVLVMVSMRGWMLVMRSVVAELVDVAAWAGVVVAMASTRRKAMVAAKVRMGWGGLGVGIVWRFRVSRVNFQIGIMNNLSLF